MPSPAVRSAGDRPNRSAAVSVSSRRAAAAAVRSGGLACGMPRLPNVPRSNGDTSVSAIASRTCAGGTANSSATSSASAVRVPWPASTLPVNAVIEPSAPTWTHASSGPLKPGSPSTSSATTVSRPSAIVSANDCGRARARSHGSGGARLAAAGVTGGTGSSDSGSSISSAARWMARRILGYAQQRQTWPASSASILASSGCGARASSAAVPVSQPGVQ